MADGDDSDGSVTIGRGRAAPRAAPSQSRGGAKRAPKKRGAAAQTSECAPEVPDRPPLPKKIFPIGTRFMNVLNPSTTDTHIHDLVDSTTFTKTQSKAYDSFYVHVLRERFHVTTRADGNVYAYIEMNDAEAFGSDVFGTIPTTRPNDDIVFLVPPTRILFHAIRPPPTSDELHDRVHPLLVRFVRMVAGATGESIKYLLVTKENQKSENPKLRSQRTMHDPDPLEAIRDDADPRAEPRGFFDAADLDDDASDHDDAMYAASLAPDISAPARANRVNEHSVQGQRNVVRDALKFTSLAYSEADAGNERMYRPLGSEVPPAIPDDSPIWVHDREELLTDIPDITHFAVKSSLYNDQNLFSTNLVFTMQTASDLIKQNAPGFSDGMWISDVRHTILLENKKQTFTLGDMLTHSRAFDVRVQWFKNIIRTFLLRHVLEFRRDHPHSGMTPARFWMYHYSEVDAGLVALAILGLTQVPELRNEDKARVGALATLICAILTNGTRAIVDAFEKETKQFPDLLEKSDFVGKFAHLTALVMSRSEGNFTKNGSSYIPNGELPRLQREISYILRWFTQQQTNSHYRRPVAFWLTSV